MRYKDRNLMEKIKAFAETYALENGGATPTNNEIGEALSIRRIAGCKTVCLLCLPK